MEAGKHLKNRCTCASSEISACTVRGILQARILEWVAVPFPRGFSQPRDRTQVSRIAGGFFTSWATKETPWLHTGSFSVYGSILVSSLVAQTVRNLPAMQETWIWSWVRNRRRNGYPLEHSCLENPRDRKAWWATVYSVAESDTTEHLTLSLLVSSASLSSVLCPTSHPPEAGGGLEASARQLQAGLVVKKLPASAGDVKMRGSIPGSGRSPGGEHANPPQYPYLQNPTDSGAW